MKEGGELVHLYGSEKGGLKKRFIRQWNFPNELCQGGILISQSGKQANEGGFHYDNDFFSYPVVLLWCR